MQTDDKPVDAGAAEAQELANFDEALVAGLAIDLESTEPAETGADDQEEETSESEEGEESEDDRKDVEDEEPESPKEEEEDREPAEKQEPKVKLPSAPPKFPDLKEGDFVRGEDGTFEIRSDHLAQDVNAIVSEDAGVYARIYRAKPDKAEAIAEIMGFGGDETRSAGRQMFDVVKALQKGDQAATTNLLKAHFPYLLDPNTPMPFKVADGTKTSREDAGVVVEDPAKDEVAEPTEEDILSAKYRIVAESEGKLKMGDIDIEKMKDEMAKYKFDIETGKPLGIYDRLNLAVNDVLGDMLEGDGEDVDDDTRKVPTGGGRKRGASNKAEPTSQEQAFSDALGSSMKGL